MPLRKPKPSAGDEPEKKRRPKKAASDKKAERKREARERRRDVGKIPTVTPHWRAKRNKCADSLLEFCRTFLAAKFFMPFSSDHIRIIARLECIVRDGGLLALAMPRGSGKTELCKAAALWAILYGHRKFVVVIGATAGDANRVMSDIKSQFAHNEAVHSAFPEATHCVRALGGVVHKAKVQLLNGEPSGLEWSKDGVQLAFAPKAACAGAVIRTAGLTGAIRGMSATAPDGGTIRPDLVLCDDPQDRQSATSPPQTDDRERIVRGDILGLAGPAKTIAVAMPCTVIVENDLADRFLDRERNPQWNGERTRLVEKFPTDEEQWATYFHLRAEDLRAGGSGRVATNYYVAHRTVMDAGAEIPWPERFDSKKYVSALEEAMVRRFEDPEAFAAEMQNDPVRMDACRGETRQLHASEVAARVCHVPRGLVPRDATRLTSFIDVGGRVMWWGVCAWNERFDGWLVDYGAYPQQPRSYFTSADARPTLADRFPGLTEPQLVYQGLHALTRELLDRDFGKEGGGPAMVIGRCLIDAGWLPDTVHQFVNESGNRRAVLLPSKGYSTAGNAKDMDEWDHRDGERRGPSWREGTPRSGRGRQLLFDPDFWKSFLADRLMTAPGGGGCLQLFGTSPGEHRLLADHITSEYATRVTVRNRTFDRWELRPGGAENHLLDVLVGCCVAASERGLAWSPAPGGGEPPKPKTPRSKVKLSDLYYQKHGGRPGGFR